MPTKADVARNDLFDPRWSVWGPAFGGARNTDGNAVLGSNNATVRAFGFAAGADYRFSPATLAGFALAGGGTNFSVNGSRLRAFGPVPGRRVRAPQCRRRPMSPAALAYGWQDVTTDRTVTVAGVDRLRAEFNANAWSGRVEGGYRFVDAVDGHHALCRRPVHHLSICRPMPSRCCRARNDFALNYAAKDVTASRTELGVRSDKSFAMQNGDPDAARPRRLGA